MVVKPIPEGYHSITPYLKVRGIARLLDFLKTAFDATETERLARGDGTIGHAEVRIGDSMVDRNARRRRHARGNAAARSGSHGLTPPLYRIGSTQACSRLGQQRRSQAGCPIPRRGTRCTHLSYYSVSVLFLPPPP
jgi:hypothetical protein